MRKGWIITLFLLAASAAPADIYKCIDAEGNVAYLQLPCPVEKEPTNEPVAEPAAVEVDTSEPPAESSNLSPEEIEACKKPYRDEVDEIYTQLGATHVTEQLAEFKTRLRTLTQQMRACG